MNRFFCILLLLICSFPLKADRTVRGRVTEKGTGQPAPGVNIMLRKQPSSGMMGYVQTDSNGEYSLSTQSDADTLYLAISGFNLVPQTKTWVKGYDKVDFIIESAEQEIKEAVVAAPPVHRRGDTLSYYVSQYRDSVDRSIGDVLQKIPGIAVSRSGGITYKGDGINRFYVEGLDMLGNKYGIATKNIRAEDIAVVEVLENHQPIKVLENWIDSDKAAINLKLKEGAKGIWTGTAELGGGWRPLQYDVQATPMMFSKNFQTVMTAKANNTGDDITSELSSQYNNLSPIRSFLSVLSPAAPPVDQTYWLRNNTEAVSANALLKTGKYSDITFRAHYIHDVQRSDSKSVIVYHLPDADDVVITERTSNKGENDNLNLDFTMKLNTDKIWLTDEFTIDSDWQNKIGLIGETGEDISQKIQSPSTVLRNYLNSNKRFGNILVLFSSNTDYSKRDERLEVSPNMFENVLSLNGDALMQDVQSGRFRTRNSLSSDIKIGKTDVSLTGSANLEINKLESYLSDTDSTRNSVNWKKYEMSINPNWAYKPSQGLKFSFSVPVAAISTDASNFVKNDRSEDKHIVISPSFSADWRINYIWDLKGDLNRYSMFGGFDEAYDGYIMQNYRSLASSSIKNNRTDYENASLMLSYFEVLKGVTADVAGIVWRTKSALSSGSIRYGVMSKTVSYDVPTESSGYSLDGRCQVRIHQLSTTAGMSARWSSSNYQVFSQSQLLNTTSDIVRVGAFFNSNINDKVVFIYTGYASNTWNRFLGTSNPPISVIQQNLQLNYVGGHHTIWNVTASHYYNNSIQQGSKNNLFLNSSISYKVGRTELILEGRNLLNTRQYKTYSSSELVTNYYEYELRPCSVLLKLRFSLR